MHSSIQTASFLVLDPSGKNCFPAQVLPDKSPFGFLGAGERRRATHSLKGSGRGSDANFCCTYFGPRLPPPCLSASSPTSSCFWATRRKPPPCSHSPGQLRLRNAQEEKTGLSVASVPRVRVQHGDLIASLSLCYLQQPWDAALGAAPRVPRSSTGAVSVRLAVLVHARTAAPSPSSWGDDFQFTWRLARLPRGRAS